MAKAKQQRIGRGDHRNLRRYGLQFVTEPELAKDDEVWKATEEVVWAFWEWKF